MDKTYVKYNPNVNDMNTTTATSQSQNFEGHSATSSEQPLVVHSPLNWEYGMTRWRYLTVARTKDFPSECFYCNPAFGYRTPPPGSSGVLGGEAKNILRILNLYSVGQARTTSEKLPKNDRIKFLEEIWV
ncbi:hypothetical protein NPIL_127701 [Nephila pilipes]|uniref:Uncharacterized protein n=1 Tax=Nephila pilipes TaxID=299642 RepID=A0A8X6P1C4_NEPPI|nr:hypothetical protein NPIL_641991 [Nephila pilipes]GFU14430.1 hypothetical protein NPIL_127701 [Nephila pilipes]